MPSLKNRNVKKAHFFYPLCFQATKFLNRKSPFKGLFLYLNLWFTIPMLSSHCRPSNVLPGFRVLLLQPPKNQPIRVRR